MKKSAFTLTEILIALGIIGIMMALSISIVKPREIQYKYQYQQAQATLTEAMREAILRTQYTDHRFPKKEYNGTKAVVQLCQGMNETLNTTKKTSSITNDSLETVDGRNNVCTITTLSGMKFYLWAPGALGQAAPICRRHFIKDDSGNTIATVPVAAFVAFVDLDGEGSYYSATKERPTGADMTSSMGNLPAFWLDEDYAARPLPTGTQMDSQTVTATSCGF